MTLLEAEALTVTFGQAAAVVRVVDGLGFALAPGRTLGVVGESGCGKSMAALAVMGLLPVGARAGGALRFDGEDLLAMSEAGRRRLRGRRMAMIFQEPMTALNPVVPVGVQIAEMLVVHEGARETAARQRAIALLERVGIAEPATRAAAYPHQLSGGMRQRVMIAMAIACRPSLLIADEPTTALDVSVQAQILDLLLELQRDEGMAMLFISHNLGVISEIADEIMVMYAGRVAEHGPAQSVLAAPLHPYTRGLIATLPDPARRKPVLPTIAGTVPDPRWRAAGCAFHPRCPDATAECAATLPTPRERAPRRFAACLHA